LCFGLVIAGWRELELVGALFAQFAFSDLGNLSAVADMSISDLWLSECVDVFDNAVGSWPVFLIR